MSLSDRFADIVTKGRYSQVLAENKALSERPGIGITDMAAQYRTRPVLNQAFILEERVSIFSEVVYKLKKEIFRPGIEVVPRFAKKCETCGHEMQELKTQCDRCGGTSLHDPNYGELKLWERADGSTFLERANENGQTLVEVLESFESNLDIADNGVLILPKRYFTDEEGNIEQTVVHEILSADPRNIEKIVDERAAPGGKGKVCLYHRTELQGDEKTRCSKCGRKLYDAHYRTVGVTGSPELYYIEGEVKWRSKYYPSLIYGYPPIFKCIDEATTYEWLERRVRLFYERGRAPGLVTIPTSNLPSMAKEWDRIQEKMKEDPYYIPWLAFDPEAKAAVSYLNLMGDPSSDMLEVKKEIRERLSSRFGVSLIYQNDVGSSGGLNNEDRQISVQYDTISSGRAVFDDDVFRWLFLQFGIKDFTMRIKRTERKDQESELNKLSLIADVMEKFINLGMDVEYENGDVKVSGKPSKRPEPAPSASPFDTAPLDAPQAPLGASVGEQLQGDREERPQAPQEEVVGKADTFRSEDGWEEWCDSIFDKAWGLSRKEALLRALQKVVPGGRLTTLSPQELESFYEEVYNVMTAAHWSLRDLMRIAKRYFPGLQDYEYERIARVESARLANRAREEQFVEQHPRERVRWSGPSDYRTTEVCTVIKDRIPEEGVTLDELKQIIWDACAEVLKRPPLDELVPHFNCRHTFVRVM